MAQSVQNILERLLKRLTLRSALGEAEQRCILELPGRTIRVSPGYDVVRIGERVTHSCIVVDGMLGRFGQNVAAQRQVTALYLPGDMANLYSVVVPEARSALQACVPTTILQIPHAALREAAANFPAIAEAFWRECVIDAAVLSEWVLNVGRRNALSRAAHLICEMACRFEAAGIGSRTSFPFSLTQERLGDVLALTSVHVNRTLKVLRDDRIADVTQRGTVIHDWAKLVHVAEFDPDYLQLRSKTNGHGVRAALEPIRLSS